MKKIILVAVMIAGSASAFSQGFAFGVKAGANLSNFNYSTDLSSASFKSKAGFVGGVYFTEMFSSKFGLQEEILYSGQGAKLSDGTTTYKENFAYVNVPILFRWQIIPAFNLHAGPQIGVLLSAKENGDDIKSSFNSSDLSLALGAGVDLPFGLNFGLRYLAGVSNIAKDSGDVSVKNTVLQVSVGYKILGKK